MMSSTDPFRDMLSDVTINSPEWRPPQEKQRPPNDPLAGLRKLEIPDGPKLSDAAMCAALDKLKREHIASQPPTFEPYNMRLLHALALAIDATNCPALQTLRNKLPAKVRTNHYTADLPLIRKAFPRIPWPDTYSVARSQMSKSARPSE